MGNLNPSILKCMICGNQTGNTPCSVPPLLTGGEQFYRYFSCAVCGGYQCLEDIDTIIAFYLKDYPAHVATYNESKLKRQLKRWMWSHWIGHFNLFGALASNKRLHSRYLEVLARRGLRLDARILDVGCGSGIELFSLRQYGFKRLFGSDPYVDAMANSEITIFNKEIGELAGEYDLVMSHNVLEHMFDHRHFLQHVRRLLAPGGMALIHMPMADSWEMNEYGSECLLICPPTHVFMHSRRSFQLLCKEMNFEIFDEILPFPNIYSLLSSEQYRRAKIPLYDRQRSHMYIGIDRALFSAADLKKLRLLACDLVDKKKHSSGFFLLRPC